MEYKLIVENWRNFIKNEAIDDVQKNAAEKMKRAKQEASSKPDKNYDPDHKYRDTVEKLLKLGRYDQFVAALKELVESGGDKKFRNFLNMGVAKYDGDPQDDIVSVDKEASIPVKDLLPTQNQVGISDSLGWIGKNKPERTGETAALNPNSEADIDGRIITANGKYIVDGHHRWSQVYFLNPEAKIPTYNFNIPGLKSGEGALRLAQLSIAATDGEVPTIPADAQTDIYAKTKGDLEKIKKILDQPDVVNDAVVKSVGAAWAKKFPEEHGPSPWNREQVVAKIAENAKSLHDGTSKAAAKGPERKYMPQPAGTEEKPQNPLEKIDALDKGEVNWNPKA